MPLPETRRRRPLATDAPLNSKTTSTTVNRESGDHFDRGQAADGAPRTRCEYRVSWRRHGWSSSTGTKTRTFSRRADADAFMDKLTGDGRPDLAPIAVVRLDVRRVGGWREVVA